MHAGAITEGQRVLLLDDLIATGGTLAAGIKLMKQVHAVKTEVFNGYIASKCRETHCCNSLVVKHGHH